MELQKMNKQRLDDIKYMGMSHGLEVLISQIQKAQQFNREPRWTRRAGEEYRREIVNVYFSWVTDNRLMAHIIVENELLRLVIPEAGHRLYANYKDGYQANGGGYNKPDHILDYMVYQAKKHIDLNIGVSHWQDFIKASLIS
jgi:hypothetical protein|tara:strand:- start:448 stop:873 length:426 start_codon:yes stop_codon:yes gene_type:complete